MRKIILFAHLESASKLKEDTIYKAGTSVGTMGETGKADGIHLHFGYLECDDAIKVSIKDFRSTNQKYCKDPVKNFVDKYGKVCDGYITMNFGELFGDTYTKSNPHAGVDYGWQDGKAIYLPAKGNYKVLYNASDSAYGNYVIAELVEDSSTKKSNEEIADEVIAGKWGTGEDRKNRLEKAGYNYNEIQAIVNKKMSGSTTTTPKKYIYATRDSGRSYAGTYKFATSVKFSNNKLVNDSKDIDGTLWLKDTYFNKVTTK